MDRRGTQVEYTVQTRDNGKEVLGVDYDLEQATGPCRICLVREKRMFKDGKVIFSLGIWSFSNDRTVRLEQKGMLINISYLFS
jgi:hypothetical protein